MRRSKKKEVMQTYWEDLVMVNYEVDREWVAQFVPNGCELDLFDGKAIVTVVAFRFRDTRFCGVRMPVYRDFAEINLRIYVRREAGAQHGVGERGVVFIRELITHRLPAWVANVMFRENFGVMPVKGGVTGGRVEYCWGGKTQFKVKIIAKLKSLVKKQGKKGGDENGEEQRRREQGEHRVVGEFAGGLEDWGFGAEEEFVGENYYAYKDLGKGRTGQFEVMHEPWKMRRLKNVEVEIDIRSLYGADWAKHMETKPRSVFYVDGSEVGVTLPRILVR